MRAGRPVRSVELEHPTSLVPVRGGVVFLPSTVEVDLVQPGGPARLVGEAVDRHGRLDVLVNNLGGVRLRVDGFLQTSDADFESSLQLSFYAALRAIRAAVAAMVEQGGGSIVNVASVNAFFQPDGLTIDYGAAKAALLNVAKSLPRSWGPREFKRRWIAGS